MAAVISVANMLKKNISLMKAFEEKFVQKVPKIQALETLKQTL